MLFGLINYRFDLKWYIRYLNTRTIADITIKKPISIIQLFVPIRKEKVVTIEELLQELDTIDVNDSSKIFLEQDFVDFFGDFSVQDTSRMIMTGEDFWFVAEQGFDQISWDIQEESISEAEKQALLLERLKQREIRLEQQEIGQ
jgi:hypothetical protein